MLTHGSGRGDVAVADTGEGGRAVVATLAERRLARAAHSRLDPGGIALPAPPRAVAPARPVLVPEAAGVHSWFAPYRRTLICVDLVAAVLAVALAWVGRFGVREWTTVSTLVAGVALPFAWAGLLAVTRAYEKRFLGTGTDEYERVFRAFLYLTALISFASYATKSEVARGFLVIALPAVVALDLLGRAVARRRLHAARGIGRATCPTLAVGDAEAVADFADRVGNDHRAGLLVIGACLPLRSLDDAAVGRLDDAGIPVVGTPETIREAVTRCGASTVAVLGGVNPEQLRWIGRRLEETDADLVVSPGLTDVAGTRLHVRPVGDLPLLHVERPELTGFRRVLKGCFDRLVAATALLVLAPVLVALACCVALTTRGPVLFRQQRVGLRGRHFTMYKFRSMYADAPARRAALLASNLHAEGPLFKIRRDPRVTPVGRVLRRYSLDELPQLLNVVRGDMSLVGPRPPLPDEVAEYRGETHRRLLVKPGITGLWQVSGRSDLSWEESVRLDLRYVENWSLALDLSVLCRTAAAVVRANGAY